MATAKRAPGLETDQPNLRIEGLVCSYWDTKRQKYVVRAWPGKAKAPTEKQKAARAEFARVSAMIKKKTSQQYEAALAATVGSPLTWKDALTMAAYGTLFTVDGADGKQYRSYRIVSEEAQNALDSITAVPGAMLVRTVDGWRGLAPGTDLEVLTWDGPTGLPDWAAITVADNFDPWAPVTGVVHPAAADFTLAQNSGGTASIADLGSGRGVLLTVPSTGASSMAMAQVPVPSQSAFIATAMLMLNTARANVPYSFGIAVTDSGGKVQQFGFRNIANAVAEKADMRFSALGTFVTSVVDAAYEWANVVPVWVRLTLAGGNFLLHISFDGETFEQLASVSKTVYLASTLSKVGPMLFVNSSGVTLASNIFSWEVL